MIIGHVDLQGIFEGFALFCCRANALTLAGVSTLRCVCGLLMSIVPYNPDLEVFPEDSLCFRTTALFLLRT